MGEEGGLGFGFWSIDFRFGGYFVSVMAVVGIVVGGMREGGSWGRLRIRREKSVKRRRDEM